MSVQHVPEHEFEQDGGQRDRRDGGEHDACRLRPAFAPPLMKPGPSSLGARSFAGLGRCESFHHPLSVTDRARIFASTRRAAIEAFIGELPRLPVVRCGDLATSLTR
jgi:hypothetical protein